MFQELLPQLYRWRSALSGSAHPVNSYVWLAPEGCIVIDPASDLTPEALRELRVTEVAAILVTHLQEENAAGCLNFPGVPIHVPEGDEYLCQGREAYESSIGVWLEPWEWDTRGNFVGNLAGARNERPIERVALGEPLCAGTTFLGSEVMDTPGHGKNAVTLLASIAGRRVAFCGDLICGNGQLWNWFDCDWDYGIQAGQRALLNSVEALADNEFDLLLPTHGEPVANVQESLKLLSSRLHSILDDRDEQPWQSINFVEKPSPAAGFRELTPHLHQWCSGNCALLVSQTGNALMVDDGLCHWVPLPERIEHHRGVVATAKLALGVQRIEIVIPTHYHGDHTENIPALAQLEGAEIVSLDIVAEPMEHPERFNLAAPLPWYDTADGVVHIDRSLPSGSRFHWHEYELEIFHLAGQTYYHAGIAVEVDGLRVLFVGDAIAGVTLVCDPIMTYNDNEPGERGWAYALDRIIERDPQLLVCGHGAALVDPMPIMAGKRAAWERRLKQFDELDARGNRRLFFDPFV